ncbi:SusC/RagA family TonB-linked outer membrane protein [Sphingobacterium sp. DN00404]|uniref:SusC/RagA family TonB-linked outer membrane protein n=1 Tax=Sphingobacterium micropteri TaxID=2763501 RepID=A0ABR7YUJ5_9SPHI|nr:SusC/RagA family TonB-linked outer membrane protein [Sphingobacterium micropteri]MBD1435018.1 SusC/RagA family TonB-linked outer membrane protein [Sphingobacterium micropteri]
MRPILLLIGLYLGCLSESYAQSIRLVVRDGNSKDVLSGVSISDCGGRYVGRTDSEGVYQLDNGADCFVFYLIGYGRDTLSFEQIELKAGHVWLYETSQELEEVLVSTGYETMSKERATGSFDYIENSLLERQIAPDIISKLEGLSPAILFDKRNGAEGNFSVRGLSTITNNMKAPLVVVDNFPYEGDINDINPNDVDNITVLKDAAASSIWGARAGNGVIVITLKKGRTDSPFQLTAKSNLSIIDKEDAFYRQQVSNETYIETERFLFERGNYDAALNNRRTWPIVSPAVELLNNFREGDISEEVLLAELEKLKDGDIRRDISKYLRQKAVNQQYVVQLSGGSTKASTLISLGYDNMRDQVVGNGSNRLTMRASQNWKPLEKLSIEAGMLYTATTTNNNGLASVRPGVSGTLYPYARLVDDNGNPARLVQNYRTGFVDTVGGGQLLDWTYVPLADRDLNNNHTRAKALTMNLGAKYELLAGLNSEFRYQYQYSNTVNDHLQDEQSFFVRDLINKYSQMNGNTVERAIPLGSILDRANSERRSHAIRGQLTYQKSFINSELNVLAGGEVRENVTAAGNIRWYGYDAETLIMQPVDYTTRYDYYGGLGSGTIPYLHADRKLNDRFVSIYLNGAYAWERKYTFSFSARRDASNLFGVNTNNKWKPLWSVGGLWNIDKDSFYKWDALPRLAVRLTYGHSGNVNNSVPAQTTITYGSSVTRTGQFINAYVNSPPNADLRWENVRQINGAIEFGTKNNRVRGSIEYFNKLSTDLLAIVNADPTLGFAIINKNSATMETHGWEAQITTSNLSGKLNWDTHWMYSFNKSTVKEYLYDTPLPYSLVSQGSSLIPIEGHSAYNLVSYRFMGLTPENGDPQFSVDGEAYSNYVDLRNKVSLSDLVFHGSAIPEHYGTVRNSFSYGSWSLSALIGYRFGYFFRRESINYATMIGGEAAHADFYDRWQQAGDEQSTNIPSFVYPNDSRRDQIYAYADILVEKGDNITLHDVNLSYALSPKRGMFSRLVLQAYARNLGILWKHTKTPVDPNSISMRLPLHLSVGINMIF